MTIWINSDNLRVNLGVTEATPVIGGQPQAFTTERYIEFSLDLTTLSTSTTSILMDTVLLPKNSFLEKVEMYTTTAATSSGAATFRIGLIGEDRSTVYSATGIVADAPKTEVATLGQHKTYDQGATYVGASIATKTTAPTLFTAIAGTAVFTAGVVTVRVWYTS